MQYPIVFDQMTVKFFTKEDAEAYANGLASGEPDGWTYKVGEVPGSRWVVQVFDDDGDWVGYWSR